MSVVHLSANEAPKLGNERSLPGSTQGGERSRLGKGLRHVECWSAAECILGVSLYWR